MREYGATETIDHTAVALPDAVRKLHPDGIDAVLDLVSDAAGFAALASLVRSGGSAVTTRYVADEQALRATGVTGVNFALPMSTELLERDVRAGRRLEHVACNAQERAHHCLVAVGTSDQRKLGRRARHVG